MSIKKLYLLIVKRLKFDYVFFIKSLILNFYCNGFYVLNYFCFCYFLDWVWYLDNFDMKNVKVESQQGFSQIVQLDLLKVFDEKNKGMIILFLVF